MVKDVFDRYAAIYDRGRRQLVPCFDEFYDALLTQIPFDTHAPLRILDLGAGTGLLSLFIARRFPNAHITLLDISPDMLAQARARFAGETERFAYVQADYGTTPLIGSFDAIVSALSIHHLADERKAALFHTCYAALTAGGICFNADQVMGATPEIERRYRATWLRQVRERGVSADDLAAALERMQADRMATLAMQLAWLRHAGFQSVDCWYQSYNFMVYGGYKTRCQ